MTTAGISGKTPWRAAPGIYKRRGPRRSLRRRRRSCDPHFVIVGHINWPRMASQNDFGSPACFRIAFANGRLLMFDGTVKVRLVIGLNQISWLPLPCR